MKLSLVLAAVLAFCSVARADSVTNLSGTLTGIPNEVLAYDFTVQTIISSNFGGYVEDILNGTALVSDLSGNLLSTYNYANDYNVFGLAETSILAEYGIYSNTEPPKLVTGYDFVASASGISIVFTDPSTAKTFAADPVATPEPMTIVLVFAGALHCWALSLKPRKLPPPKREYQANHAFGK